MAFGRKAILGLIDHDPSISKKNLLQAIHYLTRSGNDKQLGYAFRNLGIAFSQLGKYDSSITAHLNAIKRLDSNKAGHKFYYAITCEEISKVFFRTHNLKASKKYAKTAQKIFYSLKDTMKVMDMYNQMALCTNDPDSSLYYLHNQLKYAQQKGDSLRIFTAYANIGLELIEKNEHKKAKPYYLKSYEWFKNSNKSFKAMVAVNLSNIYLNENKLDSTAHFLNIGIPVAKELNDTYTLEQGYGNFTELEKAKGNYAKALAFAEKSKKLAISNRKLENEKRVNSIEIEIELNNRNKEIDFIKRKQLLLAEKNQQKNFFISIISFGLFILIILLFLLWKARKKINQEKLELNSSYDLIKKQKDALELLIENNKNLFAIVGHDLRSPIGNIQTALKFLLEDDHDLTNEKGQILKLIEKSTNDISSLLENLLIWSKTLRNDYEVSLTAMLVKEKIEKVIELNTLSIYQKNINLKVTSKQNIEAKVDAYAFETIFRNLISNSIKASDENSTIDLSWKKVGNVVMIMVEDEAGGLPKKQAELIQGVKRNDEFDKQELSNISGGLGLKLIIYLTLANQGSINYTPTKKGSRFTLKFLAS